MKKTELDKIKQLCVDEINAAKIMADLTWASFQDRQYYYGKKHAAQDILRELNLIKVDDDNLNV